MASRNTIGFSISVVASATVIAFAQAAPDAPPGVSTPVTPQAVAAGKQLYQKNCASCHGINGEGGPGNDLIPAAPSLVDNAWTHGSTDAAIFDNIKNGIGPDFSMVPFKDTLTDDEIRNVVSYLRSIANKK